MRRSSSFARPSHERGRAIGFSLLEVMMSIAILGLALTVILAAEGGLSASNRAAADMGTAATLARCKITAVEESLAKLGYPVADDVQTETACCESPDELRFSCDSRVEKVVLPDPPSNSLEGGGLLSLSPLASAASAGATSLPPQLGVAASSELPTGGGAGGASLDFDGGLRGLSAGLVQRFGGSAGDGTASDSLGVQGLVKTVLGIVYPSLKILFEASIRESLAVAASRTCPRGCTKRGADGSGGGRIRAPVGEGSRSRSSGR